MQHVPRLILFGSPEVASVVKDDSANVIEGDPIQNVRLYANNAESGSRHGVWDCSSGTFKARMDNIVEFCVIIAGEAEITNTADNSQRIVRAGDAFVMEPGLEMVWHVPNYIRKYFAISNVRS